MQLSALVPGPVCRLSLKCFQCLPGTADALTLLLLSWPFSVGAQIILKGGRWCSERSQPGFTTPQPVPPTPLPVEKGSVLL